MLTVATPLNSVYFVAKLNLQAGASVFTMLQLHTAWLWQAFTQHVSQTVRPSVSQRGRQLVTGDCRLPMFHYY